MPYIKQERRGIKVPETVGEMNYLITRLILEYLGSSPNYERYNAAVGVLECAKLELYRRKIAYYEDKKAEENGDLF